MGGTGIVPEPDRDSAPYWAALAQGRVELQRCADCGHWTWPPRPVCSGCHGERLEWHPVSGRGEVHSWVTTHRAYTPSLVDLVPYTIVLVRLDEQPDILIPGRLVGQVEASAHLRVRAVPVDVGEGLGVLDWERD
jgi:uncharacterized OB-fold protein